MTDDDNVVLRLLREIRADVATLKADVANLKDRFAAFEDDMRVLTSIVMRLEHKLDRHDRRLRALEEPTLDPH